MTSLFYFWCSSLEIRLLLFFQSISYVEFTRTLPSWLICRRCYDFLENIKATISAAMPCHASVPPLARFSGIALAIVLKIQDRKYFVFADFRRPLSLESWCCINKLAHLNVVSKVS